MMRAMEKERRKLEMRVDAETGKTNQTLRDERNGTCSDKLYS